MGFKTCMQHVQPTQLAAPALLLRVSCEKYAKSKITNANSTKSMDTIKKRVLPISLTDSSLYLGPIFSMSIVDERWPQDLSEIVVERVKDILNSEVL